MCADCWSVGSGDLRSDRGRRQMTRAQHGRLAISRSCSLPRTWSKPPNGRSWGRCWMGSGSVPNRVQQYVMFIVVYWFQFIYYPHPDPRRPLRFGSEGCAVEAVDVLDLDVAVPLDLQRHPRGLEQQGPRGVAAIGLALLASDSRSPPASWRPWGGSRTIGRTTVGHPGAPAAPRVGRPGRGPRGCGVRGLHRPCW